MKKPEYYSQTRPEIRALIPAGTSSLLDVGCGAGSFGQKLKEEHPDWEVSGIELFPDEAAKAAGYYDMVWTGDVHQVLETIRDKRYDVIVFNDLLEHLVDPGKALLQCRELLTEQGKILSSIPNMRFWPALSDLLFQGDWRYRDAGVMDETHLRFFTRKSMVRMFEDSGFDVDSVVGINKTWIFSWRWRLCNLLLGGSLQDCLYPQFAVIASPKK
jgi:2-polyprenyl-3-methyl-5-hydroxy-6-metoxy-1,4-benzoquinol methylase